MTKPAYSQFNLFIRSLLFSMYSLTSIIIYSIIVIFAIVLPLKWRHAIIRQFFTNLFNCAQISLSY